MSKVPGGAGAVDHAMEILECFSTDDRPLSLAALAVRTGYYKSTLLRLLRSLEGGGLIVRLPDKTYSIGPRALTLAAVYQNMLGIEGLIRPLLKRLVQQTGESATFNRRDGDTRICVLRENSQQSLRETAVEGDTYPLSRGATGQVLLKFSDLKSDEIPPKLAKTLPILSIHKRKGVYGYAAPVFDGNRTLLGCITVTGPVHRLTNGKGAQVAQIVFKAATDLSSSFGARTTKPY